MIPNGHSGGECHNKKVADIVVETLRNAVVKHCYGVVGDTVNQSARSLERSKIWLNRWLALRIACGSYRNEWNAVHFVMLEIGRALHHQSQRDAASG